MQNQRGTSNWEAVDFKKKYKLMKKKLRLLIYVRRFKYSFVYQFKFHFDMVYLQEQECFRQELARNQRKMLRISRDKRYQYFKS